ncbi:LEA_2 domain-containing protein [Cephalotus follicularis]|uniref:LEA_2 domain-containing protein n=1 Tax=Cephalotus follicularis TaxID=3775 RepID=A0A1Q3BVC1_CEPFO|nr:LEA_2 domain-containing protein [Cephalotus follicularis]
MADRVYPHDHENPQHKEEVKQGGQQPSTPSVSPPENPTTPSGTYVIQIPKDNIYRVPPPENATRYQQLTRRKSRRSPCCCCLCYLLSLIVSLIVLAAIAAAVFYLVVRPEAPKYSVDSIAIRGFNLTSSSSPISPEFDVTVTANNPNNKIGIYYVEKSSIDVSYEGVQLCSGALPVFYQPPKNVTVFMAALKGSGIQLSSAVSTSLLDDQTQGMVPFHVTLRAPVKIKVGSVKTWTITVKVDCDVTVDNLTAASSIVSKKCDYGVDLW